MTPHCLPRKARLTIILLRVWWRALKTNPC